MELPYRGERSIMLARIALILLPIGVLGVLGCQGSAGGMATGTVAATGATQASQGSGSAATHRRTLQNGVIGIDVTIGGDGQLVVMIPSLGRPAEDFDDLAQRLRSGGFRTVQVQPRGVGGSVGPMQGQTLIDVAADAAFVIESLGGPAFVIGHAYGQRVARALAASRPELVKAVVTLAAGGKVPIPPKAQAALVACFDSTLSPELHLENVRYAFFAPGNDPAVWRDGWYRATAEHQAAATQATPVQRWWGGGSAPMLVTQARQDAIALPGNGESLKQEFGDRVTLIEIDNAGHAMLPEQPDALARAVLGYLRRFP
jgi:pimeloyl-ACP methyl ester carboxylesterase